MDSDFSFFGFDKIINGLSLMRGIIVGNEMDPFGFPESMRQVLQTVDKEDLAFFEEASSPSQTVMDPETSHKMSDTMADVLMLPAFDFAGFHRQGWKASFQGLDRRLLIKADDQDIVLSQTFGLLVIPEHGCGLFEEVFGDLGLPIMIAVRLKLGFVQDFPDGAVMDLGQDAVSDNLECQVTRGPLRQRPVPLNGRHTSQGLDLNSLKGGKSGAERRGEEDPEGPQGRGLETAHKHPKPWSGRSQHIGQSRRGIFHHGIRAESVLVEALGVPFCET